MITATLSDDQKRIALRSPYSPAMVEFCHTLPNAWFNKGKRVWTCDFTPATAWRLCSHLDGQAQIAPEIVEASERFDLGVTQAASIREETDLPQPLVRQTNGWEHQLGAYHFADRQHEAAMLAVIMGGGKSKTAIDLMVNWGCHRVLILCPVSVLQVWPREFRKHGPRGVRLLILDKGSTTEKTERANHFLKELDELKLNVLIINYESATPREIAERVADDGTVISPARRFDAFAKWSLTIAWDCVILDESHRIKAHNSQVSRYAAKLGPVAAKRLCLTGTPMNTPLDVFGQYRFLDAGIFGTSFFRFRERYAICGNAMFPQQVTGYKNEEELRCQFRLLAFQVGPEVLDLPPVQHHVRTVDLSLRARKIYRDMETELIADIGIGVCIAANCLTRLLRLQQITSGFIVLDEEVSSHEEEEESPLQGLSSTINQHQNDSLSKVLPENGNDAAPEVHGLRKGVDKTQRKQESSSETMLGVLAEDYQTEILQNMREKAHFSNQEQEQEHDTPLPGAFPEEQDGRERLDQPHRLSNEMERRKTKVGSPDRDGETSGATSIAMRDCTSQKRQPNRQQTEEFGAVGKATPRRPPPDRPPPLVGPELSQPILQDGKVVEIDNGKYSLLLDLLTDIPEREPVVVFCRFRHDLAAVREVAEVTGRRWGELSGTRNDLVDAMLPDTIDLLGAQIRAGGLGVDLSRAHYAVYYSKGFSLLEYEQSLARLNRPGQTQPVQYYHLVASKTIDEHLEKVLVKRKDAVRGILETYRKEMEYE